MNTTTKRVAVWGAGAWGFNVVKTFHGLESLAGVIETDPATRTKVTSTFAGTPMFSTLREAHAAGLDAVAIATPAPTHFELVKDALEMGLDVFVEKPFTLSVATARELKALAERHGRVLMVGHLLLYQPSVRFLSEYIQSGKLGRVFSIHQERLNTGRVRDSEDVLWSLGVHDVAVLLDLVGPDAQPTEISARKQAALQKGIADDCFLHCKFSNGIQSHLHVSWLWPEKRRRTTVVGEAGMLVYDESNQTVTLHKKTVKMPSLEIADLGTQVAFEHTGEPLKLELQHFLDRLADRRAPLSGAASACTVVEILEAASASPTGGQPVRQTVEPVSLNAAPAAAPRASVSGSGREASGDQPLHPQPV